MKNLIRHTSARVTIIVITIIFVIVFVIYYRAHCVMVAARQYVSDVSRLQIGVSGAHEFSQIREKYSRYVAVDPDCNDEECAKFRFDNGLPINISIAHSAFLLSFLTLSHGSITGSVIDSACYGSNGGEYGVSMHELPALSFAVPFQEGRNRSSGKVAHITFNLTAAASAEQRARAYAFNLSFLGRFSACNDATDMH